MIAWIVLALLFIEAVTNLMWWLFYGRVGFRWNWRVLLVLMGPYLTWIYDERRLVERWLEELRTEWGL